MKTNKMKILAIETSCDETSISVLEASGGFTAPKFRVLSNVVISQVKIHAKWGGVVPNLAKREHGKNLVPVLKKALGKAGMLESAKTEIKSKIKILNKIFEREPELLEQFLDFIPTVKIPKIDAIAVTIGPGLEPALWVGINFAKALNKVWGKPIIPVNHMEGHIVASLLATKPSAISHQPSAVKFPAVALLVSGGHTELVLMKDWLKYKIVGRTRDDAAGEAFDKVARILGLPYPGGPEISKMAAEKFPAPFTLPRPMIDSKDFDFSFSGLKTAVLYKKKELSAVSHRLSAAESGKLKAEFCHEFQQAAIDVLVSKTIKAAEKYKAKTVILGGGVAANKELRRQLGSQLSALSPQPNFLLPEVKFTTDNAAMIGAAAYFRAMKIGFSKGATRLKANGNLSLK